MNFEKPEKVGITVYTKTNCINCDKLKGYLLNNKFNYKVIYCDDYLKDEESKKHFLNDIYLLTGLSEPHKNFCLTKNFIRGHKIRQFPIIFMDGTYMGSYYDFMEYYGEF